MTALLLKRRSGGGPALVRRVGKARRHFRVRKNVFGTPTRPRLVVTRSLRHIVAQIVDDTQGRTLASASSLDSTLRGAEGAKSEQARRVGELLAGRAREAGISKVVFVRAPFGVVCVVSTP